MKTASIDRLAAQLAEMDRPELIRVLRDIECGFTMDFTDEYLESLSMEELRHIVLAACARAEQVMEGSG